METTLMQMLVKQLQNLPQILIVIRN